MSGISSHVLDTAQGRPARGIPITLEHWSQDEWQRVGGGTTDDDGRVKSLLTGPLLTGKYRLTFALEGYLGADAFFPSATIAFQVLDSEQHYHVPLLLSPFAYSTYRGS
ncbi:MAG: hydroxyisourate hydrolase [Thermoanaerobaculia bacterium]|nr:hydroxyisourate hydrolase [Thermoanaerobaculia bacterium]